MEAKAIEFAKKEDPAQTIRALDAVFRRLLANLLLDFDNPKFRRVRPQNNTVRRDTEGLSQPFVQFLFDALGFTGEPDADGYVSFSGSKATLKLADQIYTTIEDTINEQTNAEATFLLSVMSQDRKVVARQPATASPHPSPSAHTGQQTLAEQMKSEFLQGIFNPEDFSSVKDLIPAVTKTLLTTGRVRNAFFDARGLTVRRMQHGRVYACTEKCDNECLEAHWHLYTGKGMLYAYVAHLSGDGTTLLHMGAEHGYQYNSMPGTPNFGKTVHFTEKLIGPQGNLVYNKHPNKVADSCIYCGETFYKLFM